MLFLSFIIFQRLRNMFLYLNIDNTRSIKIMLKQKHELQFKKQVFINLGPLSNIFNEILLYKFCIYKEKRSFEMSAVTKIQA